jgi:Peptidase family M48
MSEVADQIRVCPQCGSAAGLADRCTGCGLFLAELTELPTRGEWLARTVAAGRPATTVSATQARPSRSQSTPSIAPLLHPTERSRLALALVASILALSIPLIALIAAGGLSTILTLIIVLAIFLATIWFSMQMLRARLLGRSVRVDVSTFPDLQAVVDDVRATLQYRGKVEVYVIDAAQPSVIMTSLLGTRLILIEGDLVADLMKPGRRAQLTFLLGRCFGALRAKQERMDLIIQILAAANVLRYVTPFIQPYYRATAYSGDQIGMACCADLAAALEATRRLLVGKEMASQLRPGAVLPQAQLVSRRILPRLAQLLSSEPHVTNRYANLLCFGRHHDPELWRQMRASMDEREIDHLDAIWDRSPYRHRVAQ